VSKKSDEVYEGRRCAVCEEPIGADESPATPEYGSSQRVHTCCWGDDVKPCPHFPDAA
jgi:hypothetical protein